MKILLIVMFLLLAGCANPGIVQISPDTYLISREDHAGIFGSAPALKASVISDANDFAARQGKIAIPITAQETPAAPMRWARFEYQFRVVNKDDPEAKRTRLMPRADITIDKRETISEHTKKDIHAELLKLDDLRQRGLLTPAEFEVLKKKLLDGN